MSKKTIYTCDICNSDIDDVKERALALDTYDKNTEWGKLELNLCLGCICRVEAFVKSLIKVPPQSVLDIAIKELNKLMPSQK